MPKYLLINLSVCLALVMTACQLAPAADPTSPPTPSAQPTTTDRWYSLMLVTPYPWSTPLPPEVSTAIDGTYAKLDPDEPQWWNCMRCADWLPAGGAWRLQLEKGIYRIYYAVDGWRSLGSYALAGDGGHQGRIYFFNDPNCPKVIGEYTWRLEDGALSLQPVQDECAINMRAANLIKQPWLSCRPPNTEAAISDHWDKPEGCAE